MASPGVAVQHIGSIGDLLRALAEDPRFKSYPVRTQDGSYVEIALPDGGLVIAFPSLWTDRDKLQPHLTRSRSGYLTLMLAGSDAEFAAGGLDVIRDEGDVTAIALPISHERLFVALRNAREHLHLRKEAAAGELLSERYRYELDELNAIGRALSSQRDLDKLLSLILEKCRSVTGADAGSVYVVEGTDD